MNFLPSIRPAAVVALLSMGGHSVSAGPLDAYRGGNRLIVMSLPQEASVDKVAAALVFHHGEIEERDLVVIDVSEGSQKISKAVRLPNEQIGVVRKQLQLAAGEKRSVFILIGKDGGEKARQLGKLDLEKWFALIDGMPMRRQEIRNQQANPR